VERKYIYNDYGKSKDDPIFDERKVKNNAIDYLSIVPTLDMRYENLRRMAQYKEHTVVSLCIFASVSLKTVGKGY